MFKNNDRVNRFAIRKLTVGVASVLIGVCFLGGNVNTVSADPISGDAQTEESVKKDEPAKPVVEAGTDGKTESGSAGDAGAVETEQGQQKDVGAKPVVDEEPAAESDDTGDVKDGASEGKGLDHVGDAKKDANGTASSDDNKAVIAEGDKAKVNDDEANENKKEEHESSDKDESGDKLADSKIMARLARAPKKGKKDVDDSIFKIPAGVKTGHDDKGDYYIEHADVEREFNMNLHYNDVRVKLDGKGLFAIGGYDIVKKDFIPFKKIYTLTLKYSGDKYYYDNDGVKEKIKGDWIVDNYDLKVASELKEWEEAAYGEYPGDEYTPKKDDVYGYGGYGGLQSIYLPCPQELINEHLDPNLFFPVMDGKYFSTSYEETYTANEDENGNILIDGPYEGTFEVYGFDQYHGAEVDSNISKYGVSVWMGIDDSMGMGIHLAFPYVERPINDKNQSVDLNVYINYYEMPKVIAIDKNGNLIPSLDHLNPRGTLTYTSVVGGGDSIEDVKKNGLASLPNILDGYAGSAMIDISNWYQNGYHLADLGKDENEIFGFLDYTEGSDYAQGLKNFAKNNNFNIENARFYSDGNSGFFMTKDREGMILTATHDGYGLTKENRSWNETGGTGPIFIVMTPNDQTNTVIVRDSKTGKDLETVSIAGKTDETVPVNLTFPEKYVLHDGYKWITDYTFRGGSQKPVIILVDPYEHKKGDPLIDDKPEFPLPKPEKKPDDKPKTPDDKPKTPDKPKVPDEITVTDITDVPDPAVLTPNEPKEPKDENVDKTLTTGVKGQDVTKPKQNNPVKPMAQDIKQPKQPVVQKVAPNTPKSTLPQTSERSSILLSVLGGLVALTGLIYLGKDRKNKKA